MPKLNIFDTSISESQHIEATIDNDILGKLPKYFQIFSSLLEKAKKQSKKGEGDLNF